MTTDEEAQRMPNGNTLMLQAYDKRIAEVTPDGEMVLDFHVVARVAYSGSTSTRRTIPASSPLGSATKPGLR